MRLTADYPPIWLAAALALSWGSGWLWPLGVPGGQAVGAALLLGGLALMLAAAVQMALHRTTIIPHRQPSALVTRGVFALTRNPIYLGDAAVLLGAILWWRALLALPLLPAFVWIITRRFILPEEARLRRGFGPTFETWAARTPRWLGYRSITSGQ